MRYRTRCGHFIALRDLEAYLESLLAAMYRIPPLQLELDYGEGFNFWWYDDEVLHPNDSDFPEQNIIDEDYDPWNPDYDDIPF